MKRVIKMRSKQVLAAALLACALAAPAWAAAPFDGLVVFGTSLSDPGNAFVLLGGRNTPPDYSVDPFLIPDRPYARGGQHFSNGATWIEQFAQQLGLAASANPAFRGAGGPAANYAVGGARARPVGAFHLDAQVDAFLKDAGGSAPSGALYVVEMGGNDLRDALVAGLGGGPAAAQAVVEGALGAMSDQIVRLYIAGARNFLVWNAPDIGRTPAISAVPGGAFFANQLAQEFNGGLDLLLAQLAQALPGIQLTRLDVYAKLNTIIANPQMFGLSNVSAACITPGVAPFACTPADEFLFWDGIHPTRATHGIIAREAAEAVAP